MLKKRVIPVLLLSEGRMVKGKQFESFRDTGKPNSAVRIYSAQDADELVFLDVEASRNKSNNQDSLISFIHSAAEECFMPLAAGGGVDSLEKVRELIYPYIKKSIPENLLKELNDKEVYINPTGQFIIGGPDGDTGLTGRKIIVDTYGGAAPHGGGAFSGKDPTKVDRSAAYVSRYLAKNVVAAGISSKCLIQLAYAIGISKPLSIYIKLADSDSEKTEDIKNKIDKNFDLSPRGIRELLGLNKPIYEVTSAYGHFGRKPNDKGEFSWEKTDKIDIFKK